MTSEDAKKLTLHELRVAIKAKYGKNWGENFKKVVSENCKSDPLIAEYLYRITQGG